MGPRRGDGVAWAVIQPAVQTLLLTFVFSKLARMPDGGPDPRTAFKGVRSVYFEEAGGFVACDTFERSLLTAGNVIAGPAVIEQMDTTTVIPPGETARVDQSGTLIVELAP